LQEVINVELLTKYLCWIFPWTLNFNTSEVWPLLFVCDHYNFWPLQLFYR